MQETDSTVGASRAFAFSIRHSVRASHYRIEEMATGETVWPDTTHQNKDPLPGRKHYITPIALHQQRLPFALQEKAAKTHPNKISRFQYFAVVCFAFSPFPVLLFRLLIAAAASKVRTSAGRRKPGAPRRFSRLTFMRWAEVFFVGTTLSRCKGRLP